MFLQQLQTDLFQAQFHKSQLIIQGRNHLCKPEMTHLFSFIFPQESKLVVSKGCDGVKAANKKKTALKKWLFPPKEKTAKFVHRTLSCRAAGGGGGGRCYRSMKVTTCKATLPGVIGPGPVPGPVLGSLQELKFGANSDLFPLVGKHPADEVYRC